MKALVKRAYVDGAPRVPSLLASTAGQFLSGFLVCVGLPYAVRAGFHTELMLPAAGTNAGLAAAVAYVLAFYFIKQIDGFPGVQSGTHVFASVAAAYGLVVALFFLLRLPYSRFVLTASFVLSTSWLVIMSFATQRSLRVRASIVPGGHGHELTKIQTPRIEWKLMTSPPTDVTDIQMVSADLRVDLPDDWEHFLAQCALSGIPVYHSKLLAESLTGKVEIEHISENQFGSLLPNLAYLTIKQVIDWLVAMAALPCFAAVHLIVGTLILLTDGRPVLFAQQRVGYRGRLFTVYKFRTMTNPDAAAGRRDANRLCALQDAMTKDGDQRITRVGAVLRKYRIDELPQILNILKGEMSWIGPRPEAVALSNWYDEELPFYQYRHVVRPGISGWAQVNQGHVTSAEDVREKLHFDFYYIKYISPWLDTVVVLRTVRTVLFGFGAK